MSAKEEMGDREKPDDREKPLEIGPAESSRAGEWIGWAIGIVCVGAVVGLLVVWLTGSILMGMALTIGMIALMLLMGWLASSSLDRSG